MMTVSPPSAQSSHPGQLGPAPALAIADPGPGGGGREHQGQVWQRVLDELQRDQVISRASFATWLRGTSLVAVEGDTFVVGAQHRFARDKLERTFRDAVTAAIARATGRAAVDVRFEVAGRTASRRIVPNPRPLSQESGLAQVVGAADAPASEPALVAMTLADSTQEVTGGSSGRPHPPWPWLDRTRGRPTPHVRSSQATPPPMPRAPALRGEGAGEGSEGRGPVPGQPGVRLSGHPAASPWKQLAPAAVPVPGAARGEAPPPVVAVECQLNPRLTFATFVVGCSNQFAHAAARASAENPGLAYNPLLIHGPTGSGKTHLLHAIGHHVRALRPGIAAVYLSARSLLEGEGAVAGLLSGQQGVDLLLLDDVQVVAMPEAERAAAPGRAAGDSLSPAQTAVIGLLDRCYGRGAQLVLAADQPPGAMVGVDERLRSRLQMGLVAAVAWPDAALRAAIVRARAKALRLSLSADDVEVIVACAGRSVRDLEGAVTRVAAAAELARLPVTPERVAALLGGTASDLPCVCAAPAAIVQAVAEAYGVSVPELQGRRRDKRVVLPRQVAMYLLRELAGTSLADVGAVLGGRDHTTVLHGCERVAGLIAESDTVRQQVAAIRQRLLGAPVTRPPD